MAGAQQQAPPTPRECCRRVPPEQDAGTLSPRPCSSCSFSAASPRVSAHFCSLVGEGRGRGAEAHPCPQASVWQDVQGLLCTCWLRVPSCGTQVPMCPSKGRAPGSQHPITPRRGPQGPQAVPRGRQGGWGQGGGAPELELAAICGSGGGHGEAKGCHGNSGLKNVTCSVLKLWSRNGFVRVSRTEGWGQGSPVLGLPLSCSNLATVLTQPQCPYRWRGTWPECSWPCAPQLGWDHPHFPCTAPSPQELGRAVPPEVPWRQC